MTLEHIEDEELEKRGLYVRISMSPEDMQDETTRKHAEKILQAFRWTPDQEPRIVCGFEVEPGWEMPDPGIEGVRPYAQLEGGDGMSLFWWHKDWGKYPTPFKAWDKEKELGLPSLECPLVEPDTGGVRYKECERALAELGFVI